MDAVARRLRPLARALGAAEQEAPPDPNAPVSRLSRCLEAAPLADGSMAAPTMPAPYMVHMACKSKPWLPANAKQFFAIEWHKRLARANERLGG